MTESWSPQLTDLPEFAGPLLSGLRKLLPALYDAALQAPESPTRPFSTALDMADDASASISVTGRGLRRDSHGPRDALFLTFGGEVQLRGKKARIAGEAVLDLATSGILRLRLTEPVAL